MPEQMREVLCSGTSVFHLVKVTDVSEVSARQESSKQRDLYQLTWQHIPEDNTFNVHCHEDPRLHLLANWQPHLCFSLQSNASIQGVPTKI
jgi:hypothetical protein